jgi:uncharacterized protein involved in exopolysaccharide biosynthesis
MLAPLFRHRRMVIISFGSVFLLATVIAWAWAARYYVADMQVVVEQDRSDPTISAGADSTIATKPITIDQVSSEMVLLRGDDMMRAIANSCELADPSRSWSLFGPSDPAQRKAAMVESEARTLAKKINVESEKTSDVINVRYGRTGNPETPACVLQTLSKLYLEKHLQLERPAGSTDFFASETDKYQQALQAAEAKLTDFSRQQGVAAPEVLRSDMAQQEATAETSLYQARQLIAADQNRIQNIKQQMAATPARSATTESSNSSNLLLQNLQAQLLAAQVKRTQMLVKYEPTYPLVVAEDQEIAETQAAIKDAETSRYVNQTTDRDPTYEYLRQDLARTEADLASQRASVSAINSAIKSMSEKMVNLNEQAVKQDALIREAKADEGNYLLYLNKREEERTSDALDQKRIANVAIAVPPTVPLLPAYSPWTVMFLGLMLAILVSIGTAFLAEYLDPSFRTPQEVMETLSMPVLASVPKKAA